MSMQLVCTSKNIWAELSYEFGPSCLINLGRVGMGRVLCGPSWHGPSWFWAELSVILKFNATKYGISEGMSMFLLNYATERKYSLSVFDAKSAVLFQGLFFYKDLYHTFKNCCRPVGIDLRPLTKHGPVTDSRTSKEIGKE